MLFLFGLVAATVSYKISDEHDREKRFLWGVSYQLFFDVKFTEISPNSTSSPHLPSSRSVAQNASALLRQPALFLAVILNSVSGFSNDTLLDGDGTQGTKKNVCHCGRQCMFFAHLRGTRRFFLILCPNLSTFLKTVDQQNFPCVPLFLKSIFFDFGVPCSPNTAFVPVFLALFSFCSLVPTNFKAMFTCPLKPLGDPVVHGGKEYSDWFPVWSEFCCTDR